MSVGIIVVGIDGWQQYTWPLIESIVQHEPEAQIAVIDNASREAYPYRALTPRVRVIRTDRLCYSAAINVGYAWLGPSDWTVVLSNDVLCVGPFAHRLESYGPDNLVGPLLKSIEIERVGQVEYLEGWCVAVPRTIWHDIGGWDAGMKVSSYEDVEYSHRARVQGYGLIEDRALPFQHLDQRQRFTLVPDYWSSEAYNRARFVEKYGR